MVTHRFVRGDFALNIDNFWFIICLFILVYHLVFGVAGPPFIIGRLHRCGNPPFCAGALSQFSIISDLEFHSKIFLDLLYSLMIADVCCMVE